MWHGSLCVVDSYGQYRPDVDAGPVYTIAGARRLRLARLAAMPIAADQITFAWEEYDLGDLSPPSTDDHGTGHSSDPFGPFSNPSRTFPASARSSEEYLREPAKHCKTTSADDEPSGVTGVVTIVLTAARSIRTATLK
jgi:hypothetical protein